jgi:hypothetical protein
MWTKQAYSTTPRWRDYLWETRDVVSPSVDAFFRRDRRRSDISSCSMASGMSRTPDLDDTGTCFRPPPMAAPSSRKERGRGGRASKGAGSRLRDYGYNERKEKRARIRCREEDELAGSGTIPHLSFPNYPHWAQPAGLLLPHESPPVHMQARSTT